MATVLTITHDASLLNGSNSAQRGYVGVLSGNWVMRYKFTTPSTGNVTGLLFRSYWYHTAGFNFSTYPVRAYVTTSGTSHVNAGSGSTYHASMYAETSGNYNVAVNISGLTLSPSTTYYIYLFAGYSASYRYSAHNYSAGQTIYLEASVATESSLTASNGTLGAAQTITVTKQVSSYTHTITYTCGTASGTICTKSSATSISFTPPLDLASQNVNGTSVTVKLSLQTYSGDTAIGSAVTKTLSMAIPASVVPQCHVVVDDPTGFADRFGGYVQGRSKAEITVSATLAYGSAIQSKTITFDGKTYTANGTTPVISGSGTLTVNASVTDGRSRTGNASKSITVLPYIAPTVTKLIVGRCNADGTANDTGSYAKVTYSYTIYALSNQNDKSAAIQYKKTTETNWTTVALTSAYSATDATYVFAADDASSYDVKLTVIDYFEQTSRSTSVSTAEVIMHLNNSGNSISFGKLSERTNAVEFGWDVYMDGQIYGNVLTLGDVGTDNNIPDGSDFNDYLDIGSYRITSNNAAKTMSNIPEASAGVLRVFSAIGNGIADSAWSYLLQEYTTLYGGKYIRGVNTNGTVGVWTYHEWKKQVFTDNLLDLVYPVGSYYIANHTTSPAELFGGSWYRVQSRFLYGCAESGTVGATGGLSDVTLTANQLPNVTGTIQAGHGNTGASGGGYGAFRSGSGVFSGVATAQYRVDTNDKGYWAGNSANIAYQSISMSFGGGSSHTNMPPYVNVAIWRRTA